MPPVITFLSDYGLDDDFVGVCHGVIARIAPEARVIDLSHGVPRHDVRSGALMLRRALPYAPPGIHLAVVDPEVGGERRAVALRTAEEDRILVGPDNGLLSLAWEAAGGARSAVEISSPGVVRRPHAESFRAPDTLCPAAASLAAGMPIGELGGHLDLASLARVVMAEPEVEPGKITCEVIDFNRFGNVHLNVRPADLAAAGLDGDAALSIEAVSGATVAKRGSTYADFAAGEYGVLVDPRGWLTIVRGNPASALDGLGLGLAAPVWITRAG
jgi:hypothetical protein